MFTQEEIDWWRRLKQEKFEHDQATQITYARREGEEKGIKAMIITLKELNVDKATTADKLMASFGLQPKVAQGYVEANW